MQLVININDSAATRVIDAICSSLGYMGSNKNQFVKSVIIEHLRSIVIHEEQSKAHRTADLSVEESMREVNIN